MRRALVLVVVLLAAGCGSTPDDGAGLSGAVMQYRSDIASRILTVRLRASGDVRIDRLELRPGGFDPVAPVPVGRDLGAGRTADVRVGFGPPRCDGTAAGPSTAVVTTVSGADQVVTLADDHDAIGALHRAECAERAIRAVAVIGFDRTWERDGDLLRGMLHLRRTGGADPVTVGELGGTTIFGLNPAAGTALPLVLPAGAADAALPVVVEATRCDPHALAESKRATAFVAVAAVGSGPPTRLTVAPDDADRGALLDFATDVCSHGG
ncbi:hypothetical protein WIS52_06575 [Pseudonocardia nematodicida]|uniref:Lipoprotein n=1 Tax=Pseudonocardia nematodicida TaxID=1206997 RepID=A0ABV1K943_9PSEU